MEKEMLLAELKKNCEGKEKQLRELIHILDLTELGAKVQREQFKDIENRVLQENEFFCGRSEIPSRSDDQPKFGERITSEKWSFLLSDEDFDRLQALTLPIEVKEGLVDEKGYYIKNWDMDAIHAKNAVVDFIIKEIVPTPMKSLFEENKKSVVFMDKLINIFRQKEKA